MGTHSTTNHREFAYPVVREIVREDPGSEPPLDRRDAAAQQRTLVAASLIASAAERR